MDKNIAIDILRRMKLIRCVEEEIAARYSEWKMRCPTHLCSGQETVAAVAGNILKKDDLAVSSHRAHGHYLGKGGSLKAMLAEIYGKADGCCGGKGGSMHLSDLSVGFVASAAIVGGTIPIGVGLALSQKFKKSQYISCVFLGDGAIEEGVFYESLNFAVLKELPVLFLCENNLYSVYTSLEARQPKGRRITDLVNGIGCDSGRGDGNNVEEVFEKISGAVERVRAGKGPFFLEFSTYRWREHCGPNFDNDIGYRTEAEYENWRKIDPIALFEKTLLEQKILDKDDIKKIDNDVMKEVEEAFAFAENAPFPKPENAFKNLYRQ